MNYHFLFALFAVAPLHGEMAPQQRVNHAVQNLETEMNYLKQQMTNQETRLESLREETSALIKATKEMTSKSKESQEARIQKIEKNLEKLVSDLKQFKTHANESSDSFAKTHQALHEQIELTKAQGKQIHELESALKALAKAMQAGSSKSSTAASTHRVRSGESLAKIAKEYGLSASTLKEMNGLSSDKIVPGQELKVP